jgi:5'-methylthioadenosine phosphorylase
MPRIGIIGGTGLYEIDGLKITKEIEIDTPFGPPSDTFMLGELDNREIAFLARHGRGHCLMPTELNQRANIYAMKSLDVGWIISVSAVGSLKPEMKPQDIVVIDQFFDRTKQAQNSTFFGEGIVAHIQFAKPLCPRLRRILFETGEAIGAAMHWNGTYLNMEGPAFSTLAESQTFRSWGMDVIGMTQMNEARLAREAEICYATLAMVTDYDCWYEAETGETVSVDMVIENLNKNKETSRKLVRSAIKAIPEKRNCGCASALAGAILTDRSYWPEKTIKKLGPVLKKYI